VADASHEIRHPLTVLRAALDLALRRDRSADEYRTALADGISQADRVSALAEGLLTLARSDAGVLNPQFEAYDLADLVADAGRRMEIFALARNVRLDVRTAAESLIVRLDSALVGRALDNLIHNALKFTPAGGAVGVFVEGVGADAVVRVVDTGPGVAPEQQAHLFERFFRGDPSRAAEGGAGLGLAIARGIAEAHGGTVSYAPRTHTGSEFTLLLPL
jgi:signal transduction histidine kinase